VRCGATPGGHSARAIVANRLVRPTRELGGPPHRSPIRACSGRGLASRHVAMPLVGSYPTFSPLPALSTPDTAAHHAHAPPPRRSGIADHPSRSAPPPPGRFPRLPARGIRARPGTRWCAPGTVPRESRPARPCPGDRLRRYAGWTATGGPCGRRPVMAASLQIGKPSPLPRCAAIAGVESAGGVVSVPLSVGSLRLGVTQRSALWSSDFPRADQWPARGHPTHSPCILYPRRATCASGMGGRGLLLGVVLRALRLRGVQSGKVLSRHLDLALHVVALEDPKRLLQPLAGGIGVAARMLK